MGGASVAAPRAGILLEPPACPLTTALQLPDKRPTVAIGELAVEGVEPRRNRAGVRRLLPQRSATRSLAAALFHVRQRAGHFAVRARQGARRAVPPGQFDQRRRPADGDVVALPLSRPLPERVATTDLYPAVARLAEKFGSDLLPARRQRAGQPQGGRKRRGRRFRNLKIVGRRHGYFRRRQDEEDAICAEIAALKPDILWVSLGAPLEQQFCSRNLAKLKGVGDRQDRRGAASTSFPARGRARRPGCSDSASSGCSAP